MARPGGNLGSLGLIQLFRMGSGMAINVMLMRGLAVDGFGVYGYITTLVGMASFGATLGMDRLLKREIARDEAAGPRWVGTGLATVAVLSSITAVGMAAWVAIVDGRPEVILAATVAAVALGLQSLAMVPVAWFHAVRRMGLGVPANLAGRVSLVVATALLLWRHLGVTAVFLAQVLDGAVTLAIAARVYLREAGLPRRPTWPEVRALIRESVPFGLNGLFGSIYLSVDVLLLAWLRDDHEVGVYRAAVMLIALFPVIAETFTTGLYPRMARHLGAPEAAAEELRFATRLLLAISIPAAVGGMLTARPLMVFLGGEAYAESALPFLVMAPLLPLRFLNNGFGMTLSALDRQGDRTRGVFFAALVNVTANLFVLPRYGAVGAASTTLGTEILLAVWLRWRLDDLVAGLRLGRTLVRVVLPAAAMAALILVLPTMHVLLTIAIGGAAYLLAGLGSGAWHPRDLRQLRRI